MQFSNLNSWQRQVFYPLNLDSLVFELQRYVERNRIQNSMIYVASDDINYCKYFFQKKNINILTSENFTSSEGANHLMVDLAAMTASNMLICSNSSLSILGAMINNCGRVFWRQDIQGKLHSFDPWSTPILFGPVLNNLSLN